MNIEIISQPFDRNGLLQTVGDLLKELLSSDQPFYNRIWIVSAFANQQAVLQLSPLLRASKEKGAVIHIVVGVDHRSTSIEALEEILSLEVDSRVVHHNRPGHTFHPKIFLLEASDVEAKLFIGSNNLTAGGLFTNYEASVKISFDLPGDRDVYQEAISNIDRFLNPTGLIVQPLSRELIELLSQRGEIVTEVQRRRDRAFIGRTVERENNGNEGVIESPFGTEEIPSAPRVRIIRDTTAETGESGRSRGEEQPEAPVVTEVELPEGMSVVPATGSLLWEKRDLPASDVQRQTGNPTGGLRLTQAKWEVNGQVIDQTRYFRYDLFGHFNWTVGNLVPKKREAISIPFNVNLLGNNYGVHELVISHKPTGEAGQGNYTTMLHWSDLTDLMRQLNLVGRTFRLYGPSMEGEPYTIEVL